MTVYVVLTFVPLASVSGAGAILHRTRVRISEDPDLHVVAQDAWDRLEAASATYYHRRPNDAYVAALWANGDEVMVEMAIVEQFGACQEI
jgi:hypothetical protein